MKEISLAWKKFQGELAAGRSAREIGFASSDGDVSRFLARYRLAAAFRDVDLDGFAPRTRRTYAALLRLFLVWSAFENYCTIAGLTNGRGALRHEAVRELLDGYPLTSSLTRSRGGIRTFLSELVTSPKLAQTLSADGGCAPYDVCMGLRHTFAHGPLTAHAGGHSPASLRRGADELSNWLLHVMSNSFSGTVNRAT